MGGQRAEGLHGDSGGWDKQLVIKQVYCVCTQPSESVHTHAHTGCMIYFESVTETETGTETRPSCWSHLPPLHSLTLRLPQGCLERLAMRVQGGLHRQHSSLCAKHREAPCILCSNMLCCLMHAVAASSHQQLAHPLQPSALPSS